jgi:HK97 family phage prohead protease
MTTNPFTYVRAYAANVERTGPRQLTGRLVPYNEVADVLDVLSDGQTDIYREGFRAGAFSPQANITEKGVLSRIGLVHRHEGGLGYLGPFVALRETDDGLYGDATILRSKAGDVEDLLDEGVGELSVEFRLPRANHTEVDGEGVRWRTRAHLDQVALEPRGAYRSAQVLAFRAHHEHEHEQHEHDRIEAEIMDRRRRWEALAARVDVDRERQEQYITEFGMTRPSQWLHQP